MAKLDEILATIKANEILKKKEEKKCNCLLWILAIVGAVAVIAGIAYAVYRYMTPDYLDDFDEDFDDDFEEDDLDEEEAASEPAQKAEPETTAAEESAYEA